MTEKDLAVLFGKNVRRVRQSRGLSQSAAAVHIGMSRNTLKDIEGGRALPFARNIVKIINFYEVAPAELFR